MATVDSLLVQIDASTELLRKELARGTQAVNSFATTTDTHLQRASASFGVFHNRITRAFGSLRSTFALFGVGFGVNAFAGWIKSATELDKLTESEAEKLKGFKTAMDALNKSTDELGQTIAVKLAPALKNAAEFWREFLFPTGQERADKRLDEVNQQISEKAQRIFDIQSGKYAATGRGQTNETKIAQIRKEIEDLRKERETLMEAIPTPEDVTIGQKKRNDFLDSLGVDASFYTKKRNVGFDFNAASRNARTAGIEEINPANISGNLEGMAKFDFDKAAKEAAEFSKSMLEAQQRSKQFADTFASSFESRGIQALLDGDLSGAVRGLIRDFAEMIIRLTILRPLVESVANSLGGIGGGGRGGGFASLFGFAVGGRPPMGRASVVGERGPELFIPDVPGRILSNAQSRTALAGGQSVVVPQNFTFAAIDPMQWDALVRQQTYVAANTAKEVAMKVLSNRR